MKLSDFEAIARREVGGDGYTTPSIVESLIGARRKGAEIVGVIWEPETEPLPERLEFDHKAGLFWRGHGDKDNLRAEREAVRRYNAWPAIQEWIAARQGSREEPSFARLYELLDGPEGEP